MRNLLKKLHIVPSQSEDADGSSSSLSPSKGSSKSPSHHHHLPPSEQKPFSGLSGWLNSVTNRHTSASPSPSSSSSSSSSITGAERREQRDGLETSSLAASELVPDTVRRDSESSKPRDPNMEEEYQIQIALELSAREDPEAVQIEAVKQISLGSFPVQNTPAEVIAYRYWNYNALSYGDTILDGFYDLYGILAESTTVKMPSLVDLQRTPMSDSISWEAVLVNRAGDPDLLKLEQKALVMAIESSSGSVGFAGSNLVQGLAVLVADYMGGAVWDPNNMLEAWRNLSNYLRSSTGNMVFPLGRLTIGLPRHRALLFKVLADSVGIPCRLVKGQQYTGSDDGAVNIVKSSDGREYIVDLMADPGTLIPSDGAGTPKEFEGPLFVVSPFLGDVDNIHSVSSASDVSSSIGFYSENEPLDKKSIPGNLDTSESGKVTLVELKNQESQRVISSGEESSTQGFTNSEVDISDVVRNLGNDDIPRAQKPSGRPNHPYPLARSPSWTEGINSPAVRRMKVKDVSRYMIDAAKENPQLAQKLHDVLLESGVVAPPNLFTEIYTEHAEAVMAEDMDVSEDRDEVKKGKTAIRHKMQADGSLGLFSPHMPNSHVQRKVIPSRSQLDPLKPVEGLGFHRPVYSGEGAGVPCSSQSEISAAQVQEAPLKFIKHMPVAAAAAATAAVVASSMFVAAAKSKSDTNTEVPVATAATATAAALVATTAAVSRQYEKLEIGAPLPSVSAFCNNIDLTVKNGEDGVGNAQLGGHKHDTGPEKEQDASEAHQETERHSDRSTGNDSVKSDVTLDDVAEFEIPWEDIILGERIGLGSYGEVYRGDWHGTEVAVKKFLQQDISGDALEEFRSEIRIMKRLRHPNVVLFMGAITRVPNLSIVTEFLHRGSLFRLIHRPNNQLDERRRLRMALDVARGMNYLHNCTPVIVHRDLKSPNLLVDKNWVVKVCDFGLSRIKHSTFLSSRSTAGTAEWMAPEVLRNEPSDEKCDVYSFGVILWELCTLQQPWGGMNPMQVVGAVGFQHRRLDIPDDMDPAIADIILKCWQTMLVLPVEQLLQHVNFLEKGTGPSSYETDNESIDLPYGLTFHIDAAKYAAGIKSKILVSAIAVLQGAPKMRPSFSEIMAALRPLQKPSSNTQMMRQRASATGNSEKGTS